MTTAADITTALRLLVAFADDLPDGMGAEARDLMADWRARPRQDPAGVAESIRELCADFGYPNPLGDGADRLTVAELPDEERRLLALWRTLDQPRQALLWRIISEPWTVERLRLELD